MNEEKHQQEAKLNRLNKRSSSLSSIDSNFENLSSSSSLSSSSFSFSSDLSNNFENSKPFSKSSSLSKNFSNNYLSTSSSSSHFDKKNVDSSYLSKEFFYNKTYPSDSNKKSEKINKIDNSDLLENGSKMRFGPEKSSIVMKNSFTQVPLKSAKSQENLEISPEINCLIKNITKWSPKTRYLQLIAEKQSIKNQPYKSIKKSHSQERKIENKAHHKNSKQKNNQLDSLFEIKSKLKSDQKLFQKEPFLDKSECSPKTDNDDAKNVNESKQHDKLDSTILNKYKPISKLNFEKIETTFEEKINEQSSKSISNEALKIKEKQDPNSKENLIEKILDESLQLTSDKKASILATQQQSFSTRIQTEGDLSQLKNCKEKSSHLEVNETPKLESKISKKDSNKTQTSNFTKKRFINNGYKTEATFKLPTQSMVSEAKIRWERNAQLSSNFSSNKLTHTSNKPITFNERCTVPISSLNVSSKSSSVRPFLAKGSVAERVLLFEKRPEFRKDNESKFDVNNRTKSNNAFNDPKNRSKNHQDLNKNFDTLINRRKNQHSWSNDNIPPFYFPSGRPYTQAEIDARICLILEEFSKLPDRRIKKDNFKKIVKAARLPLYWKVPLFLAISGDNKNANYITDQQFVEYWKKLLSSSYDDASKFVRILTKGKRAYLIPEDFIPLIQDVIESHPGLEFLKEAVEFHSRYIHTVIARIFYCANKSWSGKLTIPELRKSNFLSILKLLEEEDDINQITDYFSYEHFYVIYCKFWELDKDHDLIIDKDDLMRHNDAAISSRMIDRIFSGAVTKKSIQNQSKMTYSEFVWFLMSEEDKRHPRSIEYWFRCMDLDGDGFLSIYELEYFYEEQVKRMEAIGIEALPFSDCLCQMLDMVKPKITDKISLTDLKNCRITSIFFDTFFNLDKYLDHEQRDPFMSKDLDDGLISDWDRFASDEYELLVAEESQTSQKQ